MYANLNRVNCFSISLAKTALIFRSLRVSITKACLYSESVFLILKKMLML